MDNLDHLTRALYTQEENLVVASGNMILMCSAEWLHLSFSIQSSQAQILQCPLIADCFWRSSQQLS